MTGARHHQHRRADRASAPLNPKPVYSSFAKPYSLHSGHVTAQLKRSYHQGDTQQGFNDKVEYANTTSAISLIIL